MKADAKHEAIIVIGCPRSGTTLLRRLLDAHPNISCPGETFLLTACARFLRSERAVDGMDVGVLSGLGYAGFESEEVLGRLREFAFAFRREHARREGKGRWAEKTAVDSFHLREIGRLCGKHAHFICVLRHGLDVACSMREWCDKSQVYLDDIHQYVQRFNRPLEAFCHAWVDVTQSIRAFAEEHKDNAVCLRYEDLVSHPAEEVRRLFEFIGEEWDSALLERALGESEMKGFSDWKTFSRSNIDDSSTGRWRRELSPATIADLAPVVNATLVDCGYEAVAIPDKDSDAEARRRYELGLLLQRTKANTKRKAEPER